MRALLLPIALTLICVFSDPSAAQMRGHGGPVRAIATAADGRVAISGGFDQAAILWDLDRGVAIGVLRFHDGAVNAVAALPDGRFATASEDGRIALWRMGAPEPERVFSDHSGPIVGLAVSPDGKTIASASWDGTARTRPIEGGETRIADPKKGPINAVAYLPDGRLAFAGYDGTVRLWTAEGGEPDVIATLPAPVNALAASPDGELVAAGADAVVRFLKTDGSVRAELALPPHPVIALGLSQDGAQVAAATTGGTVAVIDRATAKSQVSLVGPGLPVWSLAFRPGGPEIVTGGGDRMVRRWNAATGSAAGPVAMAELADPLAAYAGDRGAEVFRACVACHTLKPGEGERAGPPLASVFGRRIATAPGYRYSEPLKKMDIVWDARTISELFEVGPAKYTPGTKMPEQKITSAEDRAALVRFLEKATRPQ